MTLISWSYNEVLCSGFMYSKDYKKWLHQKDIPEAIPEAWNGTDYYPTFHLFLNFHFPSSNSTKPRLRASSSSFKTCKRSARFATAFD